MAMQPWNLEEYPHSSEANKRTRMNRLARLRHVADLAEDDGRN